MDGGRDNNLTANHQSGGMEFASASEEDDNIWVASSDGNVARVQGKRLLRMPHGEQLGCNNMETRAIQPF